MLGKKGFTLIELLVVIIIVGILASISVPMVTSNIRRARATEAVAAMGAIRTQMRLVYAEHGAYNVGVADGGVVGNVPGFNAGDLTGQFFVDANYAIVVAAATFTVTATGGVGTPVAGIIVTIDQAGTITVTGL